MLSVLLLSAILSAVSATVVRAVCRKVHHDLDLGVSGTRARAHKGQGTRVNQGVLLLARRARALPVHVKKSHPAPTRVPAQVAPWRMGCARASALRSERSPRLEANEVYQTADSSCIIVVHKTQCELHLSVATYTCMLRGCTGRYLLSLRADMRAARRGAWACGARTAPHGRRRTGV